MYCTVDLQAHDNQNLYVGRWVAVAYDIGFFVGKVTMIDTVERITINFLTKCKDSFKWPKRKDTATVNAKYIYYSCPRIQQVGKTFVLHNEDYVQTLYESYKKKNTCDWILPISCWEWFSLCVESNSCLLWFLIATLDDRLQIKTCIIFLTCYNASFQNFHARYIYMSSVANNLSFDWTNWMFCVPCDWPEARVITLVWFYNTELKIAPAFSYRYISNIWLYD